jgi:hypothetical protein
VALWPAFILNNSMTAAKNVYALMLALIIVLSGCFGATTDDSDAQDSGGNSGGTGTTFSGADNLPPVISVSVMNDAEFYEGSDCTTGGFSVSARHAMTDWDGTIQQAGWDIDLDGAIDYSVTADEGYTTLQIPMSVMIWYNTSGFDDGDATTSGYAYLQNSIAFGAQDDDGEFISSEIFLIQKTAYYFSNWMSGTMTSYVDDEPCRDFSNAADYNFSYVDHTDIVSNGEFDYLINILRTNGQAGISWDSLRITFDGNQNGDRVCNLGTSDSSNESGNNPCIIIQSGQDDTMWEDREMITLMEGGWNLHSSSTTDTATIEIELLDESGDPVSGWELMDTYTTTLD